MRNVGFVVEDYSGEFALFNRKAGQSRRQCKLLFEVSFLKFYISISYGHE